MSAIFDWATTDNLQPEPVTVAIWRKLPEDYCRQVELVNGDIVRAESPRRAHQKAARRLAEIIESATNEHTTKYGGCLDVDTDFDVLLWDCPRTTIRCPDVAAFVCAPDELRPLPARLVHIAVEVVSPGTEKTDTTEKKAEYAAAGIPWYWLVWLNDNQVSLIEIYVLDNSLTEYRLHQRLTPEEPAIVEVPVRISWDWHQLDDLVR